MAYYTLSRYRFSRFLQRGSLYLLIMALLSFYLYFLGNQQDFSPETMYWIIGFAKLINFSLVGFSLGALIHQFLRKPRFFSVVGYFLLTLLSSVVFLLLTAVQVFIS